MEKQFAVSYLFGNLLLQTLQAYEKELGAIMSRVGNLWVAEGFIFEQSLRINNSFQS
ncbi:MAG: hypothetical protein LBJ60_02210 [Tannerellaceae bacterium]|jgi:hypothetical protein|nr:hypothetical protein [Tannerellaceae bacterium]